MPNKKGGFVITTEAVKDIEFWLKLNTGDIVLVSGSWWNPIAALIKIGTLSKWNHVGEITIDDNGHLFVFQSTFKKGVHLVPFYIFLREYKGCEIGIRHLEVERTLVFKTQHNKFMRRMLGKKYEKSYWELFKAAIDIPIWIFNNRERLKTVFCSELVSASYRAKGLLHKRRIANEDTPATFAGWLDLLVGKLGKLFLIK